MACRRSTQRLELVSRRRFQDSKPRPSHTPSHEASRTRSSGRQDGRGDVVQLFGFHAVLAALRARRRPLHAIYVTEAAAARLADPIAAAGLHPQIRSGDDLSRRLGPHAVHQGVLLEAGAVPLIELGDIESRTGLILVLDQITDPHNVGAIFRTAAAYAVDAVITTDRHAPDLSGVVAKTSSGGVDLVPAVEVVNLARTLAELGDMGYWRVGLDSEGPTAFEAAPIHPPLALVLGAEDKGLRRLTRENCDAVARLDLPGALTSLNVSNACAVALTLARQRLVRSAADS